jgi:hypothetical protein
MRPFDIEFVWHRDAKGYRLAQEAPFEQIHSFWPSLEDRFPAESSGAARLNDPSANVLIRFPQGFQVPAPATSDRPWFVVGNGDSLVPYPADQMLDRTFMDLINTRPSPQGALSFANRWGLLIGSSAYEAEPVSNISRIILVLNHILIAWSDPGRAPQTPLLETIMGADGFGIGAIEVHLLFDQLTRAPRTRFTVKNMATALWLQLAKVLTTDGTILRRCAHCNLWFAAGLRTDRRLDAKFCCDEHRFLFHRRKDASAEADEAQEPPRRGGRRRGAVAATGSFAGASSLAAGAGLLSRKNKKEEVG